MKVSFRRLYELADNNLVTMDDIFSMGWGVNGEAWKWHKVQCSLDVIWLSIAWAIWKDRNIRIFQQKEENMQAYCEKIKLQSCLWF